MSAAPQFSRNPGPSWGFAFLLWAERWWPRWLFRPALMAGTWVGLAFMPDPRRHSRDYLRVVLGRPPRLQEVWRHFFAFTESLMLRLRVGHGFSVRGQLAPENSDDFNRLIASGRPALFGTFHFGDSDLLGYLLGPLGCRVSLVRLRVGNSADTAALGQRYAEHVSFLWVNDPANLLFELKAALESGASVAMKCDRLEFSARAEPFQFLGARRLFPFTIYHLAVLFHRPVNFCVAVSGDTPEALTIYASPLFEPDAAAGTAENLAAARVHFQGVLTQLETLVREDPFLWFNFTPLNPAVEESLPERPVA